MASLGINDQIKQDDTPLEDILAQVSNQTMTYAATPGSSTQFTGTSQLWYAGLLAAERLGRARLRANLAQSLTRHYPNITDHAGSQDEVSLVIRDPQGSEFIDVLNELGVTMDEGEYVAEQAANPPKAKSRPTAKAKQPRECECGCGDMTGGGNFIPGHDSKMKSRLLHELDTLDPARTEAATAKLLEKGWARQDAIDARINKAQTKADNTAAKLAAAEAAAAESEVEAAA